MSGQLVPNRLKLQQIDLRQLDVAQNRVDAGPDGVPGLSARRLPVLGRGPLVGKGEEGRLTGVRVDPRSPLDVGLGDRKEGLGVRLRPERFGGDVPLPLVPVRADSSYSM